MNDISIVLATYNGERHIEEQLLSLVNQTVKIDEIIVSDDNSKDSTLRIAEHIMKFYQLNYKIIKHDKNVGVINNFCDGIKNASGKFVFLCDQDDYWIDTKVEKYLKVFLQNPNVDLIFSDASITDACLNKNGKTLWETLRFNCKTGFCKSEFLFSELLKRNVFTGMCMAFRRDKLKSNFCFSSSMLHDECIGWNFVNNGLIYAIAEPLVLYRQHTNNVVGGLNKKRKSEGIKKNCYYIRKSIDLKISKINDCISFVTVDNYISKLKEQLKFYLFRKHMIKHRFSSFFRVLLFFFIGKYKKFSSKTESLFLKDIYVLLLLKE